MRPLHGKTESLSVRLPWLRLLGHLGVQLDSAALPTIVKCPLCGEDFLRVIPDHMGGEWFSCSACNKAGDAIQLAAWVWEISIPGAIKKLSREGFEIPTDRESIRYYVDRYVKHRDRMNSLWERSRLNHFHNSTELQRLVHKLRLRSETPGSRYQEGLGQLFATASCEAVQTAYYPRTQVRGGNSRLFHGRGWDDTLLLPYRDMPDRISGFYFIGREGEVGDRMFRGVTYPRQGCPLVKEAGLYFHPDAFHVSEQHWNNTVFAVRDPLVALQCQARHFDTSHLPLPLFAWQEAGRQHSHKILLSDGYTHHAWRMLDRHKTVFWMPKLDAAVLKQAAAVDGFISMCGPRQYSKHHLKEYMRDVTPFDLMRHLAKTARPWVEVFASAVSELSDSLVEQLARQMVGSGEDLTRLINRLPPRAAERLRSLLARTDVCVTIPFNRDQVIEKDGKWFVAGPSRTGEESILSGILRVDHVIYHKRTDTSYLEGRLIANDAVVPFCDSEKQIKKDPLDWVSQLARSRGHTLVEGKRAWSKQLLEIAYAFQAPTYVAGVDTVGWDASNARFVLPKFNINMGGRVEPALTDLLSVDVPGLKLTRPVKLTQEDFTSVTTNNSMTQTFWACLAPLVSNILAPAFARNPSGVALVGGAAHWVGFEISRAIGCQQRTTCRGSVARDIEKAYEQEFIHSWPMFVGSRTQVMWGKWWGYWANENDRGYRNAVIALDEMTGMMKAAQGGWHVVVSDKSFPVPAPWKTFAAKFVPAYLRDLAKRDFKLRSTGQTPTWLDDVLRDLSDFVEHVGVDPTPVRASRGRLWPDTEYGHARAFAHLLGLLVRSGQCFIAPEGFQRGNRLQLVRRPEGLFIPDAPLREYLFAKYHLLPEHDVVAKALAMDDALVEDQEDGWIVDEKWWKESQRVESRLRPSSRSGLHPTPVLHQPQ